VNDSVIAEPTWSAPVPIPIPRWLGWGLVAIVLLGLGLWLASLTRSLERPLQTVLVRGSLQHMHVADVVNAAQVPLGTRWSAIDLGGLRARLEQAPWLAQVRVTRQWPDRLVIAVSERTAFARWGDNQLIDTDGELFAPPVRDFPPGLPQLSGVAGQEQEILDSYRQISVALANTPFALSGLSQDARGDWVGTCQNGVQLHFGVGHPTDKISMVLGAVTRTLAEKLPQVAYVDLRYTNGFAVGWKSAPATPAFQGVSQ
jgi:cell division protein FtsQ